MKQLFLAAATASSLLLYGCSPDRPDNETLIKYRNGKLENSSVMIDGALYYSGEDGVYDQENQRIIETEKKPLLLQRDKNIYVVDGINVTEYDTAFQKQSGFELPEQPSAFAIANHSIFYADTHKEVYSQKTDLFRNGGDFTFETSQNKIYVFDNKTHKIAGIYAVTDAAH